MRLAPLVEVRQSTSLAKVDGNKCTTHGSRFIHPVSLRSGSREMASPVLGRRREARCTSGRNSGARTGAATRELLLRAHVPAGLLQGPVQFDEPRLAFRPFLVARHRGSG